MDSTLPIPQKTWVYDTANVAQGYLQRLDGDESLCWVGKGAFGLIFKADLRKGDRKYLVAVKRLRDIPGNDRRFSREVKIWERLIHPNIMELYGWCEGFIVPGRCFVMPFYRNGNVTDFIANRKGVDKMDLLTQIAAAVDYLHRLGVVHGDLKPDNFLIDDSGKVRISDFGLSLIVDRKSFISENTHGNPRWMAAEFFLPPNAAHYTKPSDVWAFAMTAFEILSGKFPFFDVLTSTAVIEQIREGKRPSMPTDNTISDPIWQLLEACWVTNPDRRPTIRTVGLVLDVLHISSISTRETTIDVQRILEGEYDTLRLCGPPEQYGTDDYACKWVGCGAHFRTLSRCKLHELDGLDVRQKILAV